MNTYKRIFVIVGAGLAGAKAAEALRANGFDGRLVLIGDEPEHPYDRPPLSKSYLTDPDTTAPHLNQDDFYVENDIELVTATEVTALDPGRATVTIGHQVQLRYDRLLLATGSSSRTLDVPGAHYGGAHYLRTLADANRLRAHVAAAQRIVVVGGGWIGTEIAAAVRQRGLDVALVHRGAMPLERVLGTEVARVYRDVHADNGVELVSGEVDEIVRPGRVEGVRLTNGTVVEGDLVVVGIGARPRTELAAEAGLAVDGGVVVDEYLRTSAPGVFAAGDVAQAWHPLLRTSVRVDHWANALNQGMAAASNMLGRPVAYERVPYLYSDQFDVGMEYSGHAPTWDEVVFRGSPQEGKFIAFWLQNSRVVAGMNVNVWDVVADIQHLVRSGQRVDSRRLADEAVPIADVVAASMPPCRVR